MHYIKNTKSLQKNKIIRKNPQLLLGVGECWLVTQNVVECHRFTITALGDAPSLAAMGDSTCTSSINVFHLEHCNAT